MYYWHYNLPLNYIFIQSDETPVFKIFWAGEFLGSISEQEDIQSTNE
jgi:hypothetical protein